jgi:hypothetical protein
MTEVDVLSEVGTASEMFRNVDDVASRELLRQFELRRKSIDPVLCPVGRPNGFDRVGSEGEVVWERFESFVKVVDARERGVSG